MEVPHVRGSIDFEMYQHLSQNSSTAILYSDFVCTALLVWPPRFLLRKMIGYIFSITPQPPNLPCDFIFYFSSSPFCKAF